MKIADHTIYGAEYHFLFMGRHLPHDMDIIRKNVDIHLLANFEFHSILCKPREITRFYNHFVMNAFKYHRFDFTNERSRGPADFDILRPDNNIDLFARGKALVENIRNRGRRDSPKNLFS